MKIFCTLNFCWISRDSNPRPRHCGEKILFSISFFWKLMVFNYWGGRLVLRKPVNLGKNSYFSSQATIWSEVVHSLIQTRARRVESLRGHLSGSVHSLPVLPFWAWLTAPSTTPTSTVAAAVVRLKHRWWDSATAILFRSGNDKRTLYKKSSARLVFILADRHQLCSSTILIIFSPLSLLRFFPRLTGFLNTSLPPQ